MAEPKEFKASSDKFTINVTSFKGEKVTLSPKNIINGEESDKITKQWAKIEKAYNEQDRSAEDSMTPVKMYAKELACIYNKPEEWWIKNFDASTCRSIISYIAPIMAGAVKND
jgi:hypothetical protein